MWMKEILNKEANDKGKFWWLGFSKPQFFKKILSLEMVKNDIYLEATSK